jgi:pimeloyl-ACP methyl ester carboxylesterase
LPCFFQFLVENDLEDVILVGHSYGGMVITGFAARMAKRIRRLVYLDAALPDPGQSLFDVLASGGVDPMSVPVPISTSHKAKHTECYYCRYFISFK